MYITDHNVCVGVYVRKKCAHYFLGKYRMVAVLFKKQLDMF